MVNHYLERRFGVWRGNNKHADPLAKIIIGVGNNRTLGHSFVGRYEGLYLGSRNVHTTTDDDVFGAIHELIETARAFAISDLEDVTSAVITMLVEFASV